MGYYQRHIFFCLNDRENGENSCAHHGARDGFDPLQVARQGERLAGRAGCASNKSGCLDRCAGGPVAV